MLLRRYDLAIAIVVRAGSKRSAIAGFIRDARGAGREAVHHRDNYQRHRRRGERGRISRPQLERLAGQQFTERDRNPKPNCSPPKTIKAVLARSYRLGPRPAPSRAEERGRGRMRSGVATLQFSRRQPPLTTKKTGLNVYFSFDKLICQIYTADH